MLRDEMMMQCVNFIHPIIFHVKVKEDVEDDTLELFLNFYFQKNFIQFQEPKKDPTVSFIPKRNQTNIRGARGYSLRSPEEGNPYEDGLVQGPGPPKR